MFFLSQIGRGFLIIVYCFDKFPYRVSSWLLAVLLALSPAIALRSYATGFALDEATAVSLGTNSAGRATLTRDASTAFYNPAGMVHLEGTQTTNSLLYINVTTNFENRGSVLGGQALSGGDGGEAGGEALVPALFVTHELTNDLWFGFSLTSPFGLSSEYDSTWVGRYHAIKSELLTVNLNPAVAYRVNRNVSLGIGFNLQYARLTLSNAIDMGSLLGVPQQLDGRVKLDGDSFGVGFNIGIMADLSETLRVGVTYRSSIEHDATFDADFGVPDGAGALTAAGLFLDTKADVALELPETLSLGVMYRVTPSVLLLSDVSWTRWSRFDRIFVDFENPAQPDLDEPQRWNNTLRLAAATQIDISEDWRLDLGVAFDESPVPDGLQRPRLPVGDRWTLSAGLGYSPADWLSLDVGYIHAFNEKVTIDLQDQIAGNLSGRVDSSANLIAVQLNMKF